MESWWEFRSESGRKNSCRKEIWQISSSNADLRGDKKSYKSSSTSSLLQLDDRRHILQVYSHSLWEKFINSFIEYARLNSISFIHKLDWTLLNAPEACLQTNLPLCSLPHPSDWYWYRFYYVASPKESINNHSKSSFLFSFTSPKDLPWKNVHDTDDAYARGKNQKKRLKLIFYFSVAPTLNMHKPEDELTLKYLRRWYVNYESNWPAFIDKQIRFGSWDKA